MSFSFDATPKGAAANSYGTVAEADDYFAGRQGATAWASLTVPAKEKWLVTACNRLEAETYLGEKTVSGQRLKHPRTGIVDEAGYEWDPDVVSRYVKEAQFELAWAMYQGGDFFADTGLEQFESVELGPLAIAQNKNFTAGQLPASVSRLLRGFRVGARILRG